MPSFGIIAEGPTDQTVIENILLGYFDDPANEARVEYVQPPRPLTERPGGWGNVFECLKRKDHEGALQYNDYLVIQIDTDVQEKPGFDVPKREGGRELSVLERVNRVIEKIKSFIDAAFYEANKDRFVFAVTVDTIECWLLPLLYNGKKMAKITGCLEAANRALRQADQDALSAGEKMFIPAFEKASRGYRKRATLIELHKENPSLMLFVKQLDDLQARRNTTYLATPQVRSDAATPEAS